MGCIVFFNDAATTEIYTLSLHDALPIFAHLLVGRRAALRAERHGQALHHLQERAVPGAALRLRSEEHTSELQSRQYLVCRLLLEKNSYCTSKLISRAPPDSPPPPIARLS